MTAHYRLLSEVEGKPLADVKRSVACQSSVVSTVKCLKCVWTVMDGVKLCCQMSYFKAEMLKIRFTVLP